MPFHDWSIKPNKPVALLLARRALSSLVPASRQLEFNTLMLEFYPTGDVEPMTRFLASCIDPRAVKIINETQL